MGYPAPAPAPAPSGNVPDAPIPTYALPDDSSIYIYFNAGAAGSYPITNYEYSIDNGTTFIALSPSDTTSPIKIPGLTNEVTYSIVLRAVNSVGPGSQSIAITATPVYPSITPTPWLYFDPAVQSSYSGSGTSVNNIGFYGALTGTKGDSVSYLDDPSISRKVFDFTGATGNANVITFPQFNFGTAISVSAWIYPRLKANINGLLVNTTANVAPSGFKMQWNWWNGDSRVIGMQAGNNVGGRDNYTLKNTIVYDEWQHIAYDFDQANRKIIFFRNGVPVDMTTTTEPVANIGMNQAFNIGGYINGTYTMNAKLGCIKVFNKLLNATEVMADFNKLASAFIPQV